MVGIGFLAPELFFAPLNFWNNLRFLVVGMGAVFGVMGVIVVATMLAERWFSGQE